MLEKDQILWCYCELCKTHMLVCPRCGNNCCNGGSGPADLGDPKDYGTVDSHCYICPEVYKLAIKSDWKIPSGYKEYSYPEAKKIVKQNRKINKYRSKN